MSVLTHALVGDGEALASADYGKIAVHKVTLDASDTNITAADVVKLMVVPANVKVISVDAIVTTAEGGTLTIDVGDYTTSTDAAVDADGYLDGFNGNSAAATSSTTETLTLTEGTPNTAAFSPAYARGKVYTAEGSYIGALYNNTADTAVIDFYITCLDLS